MLQESFEYALGKFSFSQSNIIKIAEVQTSFKVGLSTMISKILCSVHYSRP